MKFNMVRSYLLVGFATLAQVSCAEESVGEPPVTRCLAPEALAAAIAQSEAHMETFIEATETRMGVESEYGLALAVSACGEVVWQSAYGFADIENQTPVTNDTKFRIGSVSKTLTATALGQLAAQGQLDLDAEVQTYVPDFPRKEFPITVRQVGGHIAGIRHYEGNEFYSAKHYETVGEGLAIFQNDPLLFEPGTRYQYSTYGWNLLSAVVEGASVKSFLGYMDEYVFGPAGMGDTAPDMNMEDIPNRTSFYHFDDDRQQNEDAPYVDNSNKWAGGGFLSTPTDVLRFSHAMTDGTLVDEATLRVLTTSQATSDGRKTGYGIGWATDMAARQLIRSANVYPSVLIDRMKETIGDSQLVGHTGGSVGGLTVFMTAPDLPGDIAIVAVSNNDGIGPSFALPVMVEFIEVAGTQ